MALWVEPAIDDMLQNVRTGAVPELPDEATVRLVNERSVVLGDLRTVSRFLADFPTFAATALDGVIDPVYVGLLFLSRNMDPTLAFFSSEINFNSASRQIAAEIDRKIREYDGLIALKGVNGVFSVHDALNDFHEPVAQIAPADNDPRVSTKMVAEGRYVVTEFLRGVCRVVGSAKSRQGTSIPRLFDRPEDAMGFLASERVQKRYDPWVAVSRTALRHDEPSIVVTKMQLDDGRWLYLTRIFERSMYDKSVVLLSSSTTIQPT